MASGQWFRNEEKKQPIFDTHNQFYWELSDGIRIVVVLNKSLPPTDQAYGQSISQTFSDPFVRDTFHGVAFISGVITFPAAYFCLRGRNLRVAVPIVFGSVLLWVAAVNTYAGPVAWLGSYVVLFGSLLFCKLVENLKSLEL